MPFRRKRKDRRKTSQRERARRGDAIGMENARGKFQTVNDLHISAAQGCDLDKLADKLGGE